jgi:hypothetical protein
LEDGQQQRWWFLRQVCAHARTKFFLLPAAALFVPVFASKYGN